MDRNSHQEPLVGLLVSETKLRQVLQGRTDRVYCRYARYAREVGAVLVFFASSGLDAERRILSGYRHRCGLTEACAWEPVQVPVPRVVYDRCFGESARPEAVRVREVGRDLGYLVINNPPKITKLMTFAALSGNPDLAEYLPFTAPLTADSLAAALEQYPDLYVKPDNLYKGKGILRLTRDDDAWLMQHREDWGNACERLTADALMEALEPLCGKETRYLIQEGLDLATYAGNRFDFRSLVQKDGWGCFTMTGLVARIAAVGSVITSPRSGGQVAPAVRALESLFGDQAGALVAEIERVSVALATAMEENFGICAELGLDLGVTRDGRVKLIEINGKPLRVSLERLNDPLISERIDRYPIHYAAWLAVHGPHRRQAEAPRAFRPARVRPLVGVLLGPNARELLQGAWAARYRRMMHDGRDAEAIPFIFTASDVSLENGRVDAWIVRNGNWVQTDLPLPDVIYHRAIYSHHDERAAVRAMLRQLTLHHGTVLLNSVSTFTKLEVHEALTFFPSTAALAPETRPYSSGDDLAEMLRRHRCVFVKADDGSHGTEVVRVAATATGWGVQGQIGGRTVAEAFTTLEQLQTFLALSTAGRQWIVQQGIALPQVDGRICDLRVIMQKDGEGRWEIPLVLLRWGREGKVAANMSQGGEPFLPAAFSNQFGDRTPVLREMEHLARGAALQAALALEAKFGLLGEIGIDVAVDEDGRAWILEANTKPVHPMITGLPVPLERNPFHYAAHLAQRARTGRNSGLPVLI